MDGLSPSAHRPKVRPQLVPTYLSLGGGLDQHGVFSGNSLLSLQPLPDGTLSDADTSRERGLRKPLLLEVGLEVHGGILGHLVGEVNSHLVAAGRVAGHGTGMNTAEKRDADDGVPADVKKKEGQALAALWKSRSKRSQFKFAEEHGFSQGNFSHYVGGRQPIPLRIGIALAEELGVKLAEISPRLDQELEAEKAREARIWPFKNLRPSSLSGLTPGQLMAVESSMLQKLEEFTEPAKPAATPRTRSKP